MPRQGAQCRDGHGEAMQRHSAADMPSRRSLPYMHSHLCALSHPPRRAARRSRGSSCQATMRSSRTSSRASPSWPTGAGGRRRRFGRRSGAARQGLEVVLGVLRVRMPGMCARAARSRCACLVGSRGASAAALPQATAAATVAHRLGRRTPPCLAMPPSDCPSEVRSTTLPGVGTITTGISLATPRMGDYRDAHFLN